MTEERSTLQEEFFDEAMGIRRFHTIDGETMMDKQIAPQEFAVAEILPYGMTVLSGPSKAGKSFLTLNLCLSVAKGEPFLGFPTKRALCCILDWRIPKGAFSVVRLPWEMICPRRFILPTRSTRSTMV